VRAYRQNNYYRPNNKAKTTVYLYIITELLYRRTILLFIFHVVIFVVNQHNFMYNYFNNALSHQ
jgi:hypothetical protein